MGPSPYRGPVDTCVACGAELGVGRFCLNCGHRIGTPAPARPEPVVAPPPVALAPPADPPAPIPDAATDDADDATPRAVPSDFPPRPDPVAPPVVPSVAPPVQAADPVPVPVTSPPHTSSVPPSDPPEVVGDVPPDEPAADTPRRTAWDPREDLLPYEEVDDLDSDLPVRGKAWIGWVLAAALLMGAAFLLLRVFDTNGDVATDPATDQATGATSTETTPPDSGATEEGADAPTGVGKVRELARGATFEVPGTAPPTTDLDGNLVAYEASQMGDGNPATAWRTAGDATGQTITVTLPEPGVVTRVGLVNGYAKQIAGVSWYPNNRRTVAVSWGFDDGTSVEQTFAERPGMQRVQVPPVETATVTITFTAVTPPGLGNLGRDYTAISEVSITGRRAG